MKKPYILTLASILTLGTVSVLASCGETSEPSSQVTPPTSVVTPTTSEDKPTTSEEVKLQKFTVTLEGEKKVNKILTVKLINESKEEIKADTIKATKGEQLVTIEENKITLLGVGEVELTINKEGYEEVKTTFTIAEADPVILQKFNVSYKGHAYKGEQVTLLIKDEKEQDVVDYDLTISKGADIVVKNEDKLTFLDAGTVTLEFEKEGFEKKVFSIEVNDVTSMKDIKANINAYNGKKVTVRGKVTSTYGNTFYVMDGKEGFLVYNIQSNPLFGTAGDAFEFGQIANGINVLVSAYVENGKFGLQLSGFTNGEYADDCTVNLANGFINEPVAYEVKTEEDLANLTKDPLLAGSRVRITGKYLSGDFSAAEQINAKSPVFDMMFGTSKYSLRFDKNGNVSKVKSYWNAQKIEQNEYVTVEGNFTNFKQENITIALANEGTVVINESKNPDAVKVTSTANQVIVGQELELNVTKPETVTGEITYEITQGKENATITGNKLKGVKPGNVTLIAHVGTTNSLPFEVLVTAQAKQTVKEVLDSQDGSNVNLLAKVVALTNSGFVVADETGYILCYDDAAYELPELNSTVEIEGSVTTYEKIGQKQIVNYTYKASTEVVEKTVEYTKMEAKDLATLTDEQITLGTPVTLDMALSEASAFQGIANFTHPEAEDVVLECTSLAFDLSGALPWGANGEPYTVSGIIKGKYIDNYDGATKYVIYITALEEAPLVKVSSITISSDKNTITNADGSTGAGRIKVDVATAPFNGDTTNLELVAIDHPELVTIEYDNWSGGYKVKTTGTEGTVTLVAKCDGVESNKLVITIKFEA